MKQFACPNRPVAAQKTETLAPRPRDGYFLNGKFISVKRSNVRTWHQPEESDES
jgi:hypothetical protein